MELQTIEELDIWAAEKILTGFNCPYIFKWKIPGHLDFFFWKKCPETKEYRLFIIQEANKTLFTACDLETRSKYTPFLEEFIIDFKAYAVRPGRVELIQEEPVQKDKE